MDFGWSQSLSTMRTSRCSGECRMQLRALRVASCQLERKASPRKRNEHCPCRVEQPEPKVETCGEMSRPWRCGIARNAFRDTSSLFFTSGLLLRLFPPPSFSLSSSQSFYSCITNKTKKAQRYLIRKIVIIEFQFGVVSFNSIVCHFYWTINVLYNILQNM